jgi:hypothetical protein
MFMIRPSLALLLATLSFPVSAQNDPPPASAASSVSATLRPALAQVGQSLSEIGIRHWKAPNEVRSAADQDVSSIQRDLNGPLAGLLQQADAAPGSVPAAFAVYRNVDALYDTLLRVVLTANLAAPDSEATSLQGALSNLESARTALGDSILGSSQAQQAELIRVRAALASAATVQRAPAKTTVVDDGPAKDTTTKHKKPATTKKPASTPSNPDSTSGSAPQSPFWGTWADFREPCNEFPCLTQQGEPGAKAGITGRVAFWDSQAVFTPVSLEERFDAGGNGRGKSGRCHRSSTRGSCGC